jgi:hypothetical protein
MHGAIMQKTWEIVGSYGTWSMTIVHLPGDPNRVVPIPAGRAFEVERFEVLGQHFLDLINLEELLMATD